MQLNIYIHVLFSPTKRQSDLSNIFNIRHLVFLTCIPHNEPVQLLLCEHGNIRLTF